MNVAELKQKWTARVAELRDAADSNLADGSSRRALLRRAEEVETFLFDLESLAAQPVVSSPEAAEVTELERAARALVALRVGELPTAGYLRDTGETRAALGALTAALRRE